MIKSFQHLALTESSYFQKTNDEVSTNTKKDFLAVTQFKLVALQKFPILMTIGMILSIFDTFVSKSQTMILQQLLYLVLIYVFYSIL